MFSLADTSVREVMTPRLDVVSLTLPLTAADLRKAVTETGHSRFPVTAAGLDDLTGMVHVKDLLRLQDHESAGDLARLLRPPIYVPEAMSVLDTLEMMRSERHGMAVVVDEHGGVEGIVTIKDLVSELVGELQDEFDPGTPSIARIASRVWIADGRVDMDDLCEEIGLDKLDGPYSTVGGFILATFGKIPSRGDEADSDDFRYTVIAMDRQRVDRVRIEQIR